MSDDVPHAKTTVPSAGPTDYSLVDAFFSEFVARRMTGETFDPGEIWNRSPDQTVQKEVRQRIENYLLRGVPGLPSIGAVEQRPLLENFVIERELGRGGMGVVYLAMDRSLKRRVALKVLPPSFARNEILVKRFSREAQAAARLRHPNIVPVYSSGELGGTYYYTMEHVSGISLEELIRAMRSQRHGSRGAISLQRFDEGGEVVLRPVQRLSDGSDVLAVGKPEPAIAGVTVLSLSLRNYVREAVRLFAELADALDYAHRSGVVHRDIKPSNLLIGPDGRLVIADFGLAKVGDDGSITHTGELMGSPAYMSPEQAMTRRIPVDHRTDIWSLGVTLYEFLTLVQPFEARSIELTLKHIITLEPRSPRKVNSRLPKDVETIVQKTMEKDPDRRYPTAGDLAEDLRRFLNYEAVEAKSAGLITRSFRFARRHGTFLSIGALAAGLLLVATAAVTVFQNRQAEDRARFVSGVLEDARRHGFDDGTARDVERALRDAESRIGDPNQAIDQLGVREIRRAKDSFEGSRGSFANDERVRGQALDEAMRSLDKIRVIYRLAGPAQSRDQLERIDRASAELRVKLVWAIVDELVGRRDRAERRATLLEWLEGFVGTRDFVFGQHEENPLVRVNAIEALRELPPDVLAPDVRKQLLKTVLKQPGLHPMVQRAAVYALVRATGADADFATLDLLAERFLAPDRPVVDFRVRYEVARAIAFAVDPNRYRDVLISLQRSSDLAIARLAEGALRRILTGESR
ncbi:MAG: protein kinase [Planctomycetes bacterium]|nr:protein kinase [Planctomycetota bacterium]MBI3847543.1 protein kinase [Planctomycetota bacterium]